MANVGTVKVYVEPQINVAQWLRDTAAELIAAADKLDAQD